MQVSYRQRFDSFNITRLISIKDPCDCFFVVNYDFPVAFEKSRTNLLKEVQLRKDAGNERFKEEDLLTMLYELLLALNTLIDY